MLEGIRVLDATQVLAGPICSMHLGDLGAEVIKVEKPDGGDIIRGYEPFVEDQSAYFAPVNRNKNFISIDLSKEEGQAIFLQLAEESDIIIESFKRGATEKLGIDYETTKQYNSDLIYCSIKGFGEGSEYEDLPAYDMIMQAMSGSMSLTGEQNGPPLYTSLPVGDLAASMYAIQSILGALYHRDTANGGGEFIEVPMLDSLISWLGVRAAVSLVNNEPYPRSGNEHGVHAPIKVFKTKDSYIAVCVGSQSQWPGFCEAIEREDLVNDQRFATISDRSNNRGELYTILDSILEKKQTEEWFTIFREHGVPSGPVYDTCGLWEDKYTAHQDLLVDHAKQDLNGTLPGISYPAAFSDYRTEVYSPTKELGEDTVAYLRRIGYTTKEINELRRANII